MIPVVKAAGPTGMGRIPGRVRQAGKWLWVLLALAVHAADQPPADGFRWETLPEPGSGSAGFATLDPAATGLRFTNRLEELDGARNRVLENGAGVAVGDCDGDGLPEIFLCSLNGASRLFRNLGGWRFEDATASSGLAGLPRVLRGAVFADVNADARPDLLVSTLDAGVRCYLNGASGVFSEATEAAGTRAAVGATTLTLADVDGNGSLDLYVATYRPDDIRDSSLVEVRMDQGRPVAHPRYGDRLLFTPEGGVLERGDPDLLYLNDGRGHFREVSWSGGAFLDEDGRALQGPPRDWGLSAAFRDVNGDLAPDLYVCNDYWTPDRFWINDGSGHFRAIARTAVRHTSENSMGVDFADLDRDGWVDFLVVDMLSRDPRTRRRQALAQTPVTWRPGDVETRPQIHRNTLFLNRGDGTFAEVADAAGLHATGWSWQPLLLDVDLDGWEDVLVPSGHRRDVQDLDATARIRSLQHPWPRDMDPAQRQERFVRELMEHSRMYPTQEEPIAAFRNQGGLRFEDRTDVWGTGGRGVHQGIASGDLDGDGDLDLVVNRLNGSCLVLRNGSPAPRVAVRLHGSGANTGGVGARLRLLGGAVPEQVQEVVCGGRYLSGCDPLRVFAAGEGDREMVLEVTWRSGQRSRITGVRGQRRYDVFEGPRATASPAPGAAAEPWFADRTALLGHRHAEDPSDDYSRQPLLPRGLGHLGPGLAWWDLNGDGWEDLVVGGAGGFLPQVFLADGQAHFVPVPATAGVRPLPADSAGLVGWTGVGGVREVLAAVAGRSGPPVTPGFVMGIGSSGPRTAPVLSEGVAGPGPLAVADYDGDGDLDLFVGGRWIPGRYPELPESQVFRRQGTLWESDPAAGRVLRGAGMVSGAVWSDLTLDGRPELILSCDWGPIRIYRNESGSLVPWDPDIVWAEGADEGREPEVRRLSDLTGWWNGITTADLDGDGHLDLVASNWGWNTPWQPGSAAPLTLYFGELVQPGSLDLVEMEHDAARKVTAPRLGLGVLGSALPVLAGRYPTHRRFAEATEADILLTLGGAPQRLQARSLTTCVFLQRDGHFEVVALPREAQWSPAFGIGVADFDGDGREDLVLGQNFSDLPPRDHRLDAGTCLVLRGAGNGRFEPLSPSASGVAVHGDQRGVAVCDFDHDGRPDLAVAQNAGPTRLFQNRRSRPGLRVRLAGPPGNPEGVGAVLQVRSAEHAGPLREIRGGGGYWSQDAPVTVHAVPGDARKLWVRWPGGLERHYPVPEGALEMQVDPTGAVVR